jgi:rare lipoprotein A
MKIMFLFLFLFVGLSAFAGINDTVPPADERLKIQEGVASFYGKKFHLRKTASGEIFDMKELTAAHKYLPFGTMLKVTNLKNGHEVWVRVNDRLPHSSKRIIDISRGAAEQLDMIRDGIVKVRVAVEDEEIVMQLREHFQEEKPEDLRLRIYESPIDKEFERPQIFTNPLRLNFYTSVASVR